MVRCGDGGLKSWDAIFLWYSCHDAISKVFQACQLLGKTLTRIGRMKHYFIKISNVVETLCNNDHDHTIASTITSPWRVASRPCVTLQAVCHKWPPAGLKCNPIPVFAQCLFITCMPNCPDKIDPVCPGEVLTRWVGPHVCPKFWRMPSHLVTRLAWTHEYICQF